jgi:hypothetical protein
LLQRAEVAALIDGRRRLVGVQGGDQLVRPPGI